LTFQRPRALFHPPGTDHCGNYFEAHRGVQGTFPVVSFDTGNNAGTAHWQQAQIVIEKFRSDASSCLCLKHPEDSGVHNLQGFSCGQVSALGRD
jgi:hypothetical protein